VWTVPEDAQLRDLVKLHGEHSWTKIAESLPGRVGKQCRDRWTNHLSPQLDKNKWTPELDAVLFDAVERMGKQWAEISRTVLPGRSDLSIKNRYYSTERKKLRLAEQESASPTLPAAAAVVVAAAAAAAAAGAVPKSERGAKPRSRRASSSSSSAAASLRRPSSAVPSGSSAGSTGQQQMNMYFPQAVMHFPPHAAGGFNPMHFQAALQSQAAQQQQQQVRALPLPRRAHSPAPAAERRRRSGRRAAPLLDDLVAHSLAHGFAAPRALSRHGARQLYGRHGPLHDALRGAPRLLPPGLSRLPARR
jgi:hypothetical protein